jgi:hypothetical protein
MIPIIFMVAVVGLARGAAFFFRRFNSSDVTASGIASLVAFVVGIALFFTYIVAQSILVYFSLGPLSKLRTAAEYIVYKMARGEMQGIIQVFSALGPGLYLTAMVLGEPCESEGSISQSAGCSFEVARGEVPQDQLFLTYLLPLCSLILAKGTSRWAALLSWIISMGFVIGNIAYLGDWYHSWDILYGFIIFVIMYEHERTSRNDFIKCELAVDDDHNKLEKSRRRAALQLLEEKHRHQRELETVELQRKREETEREIEQFRRVVAQVALDLKTPLQAIFMDLESLREMSRNGLLGRATEGSVITGRRGSDPNSSGRSSARTARRRSSAQDLGAHDVISSLFASCNFLHMAVNRYDIASQ